MGDREVERERGSGGQSEGCSFIIVENITTIEI